MPINDLPVLVDFYTTWCPPCKALAPYLDELAAELSDKIIIKKINIDNNANLAQQYNIMTVPTLILFKNNQILKRRVGGGTKEAIYNFIKDVL